MKEVDVSRCSETDRLLLLLLRLLGVQSHVERVLSSECRRRHTTVRHLNGGRPPRRRVVLLGSCEARDWQRAPAPHATSQPITSRALLASPQTRGCSNTTCYGYVSVCLCAFVYVCRMPIFYRNGFKADFGIPASTNTTLYFIKLVISKDKGISLYNFPNSQTLDYKNFATAPNLTVAESDKQATFVICC